MAPGSHRSFSAPNLASLIGSLSNSLLLARAIGVRVVLAEDAASLAMAIR